MKNLYSFQDMLNATKTAIGEEKTLKLVFNGLEKAMIIPQGSSEKFLELLSDLQEDNKNYNEKLTANKIAVFTR